MSNFIEMEKEVLGPITGLGIIILFILGYSRNQIPRGLFFSLMLLWNFYFHHMAASKLKKDHSLFGLLLLNWCFLLSLFISILEGTI